VVLLRYNPGYKSVLGAAVAIAAMIAYTHVNIKEQEERKALAQAATGAPKSPGLGARARPRSSAV